MFDDDDTESGELRLFLEEVSCDLLRFEHVRDDGLGPEAVETLREVRLDQPGTFADIVVRPGDAPPYFVEIKWGYDTERLVHRLARKYRSAGQSDCRRLLVISDLVGTPEWPAAEALLRDAVDPAITLECWGEREVLARIRACFGLDAARLDRGSAREIRDSIMRAEWRLAFGDTDDRLAPTLLWHFSAWSLKRLREEKGYAPDRIFAPGTYRNVAIVMADICSFSSYVRDTRDEALVRRSLTAFYSQARQAIVETGGMIDKFVGDEVIGMYGFPDARPDFASNALRAARRLIDIGNSVAEHWQSRIDRVQKSGGVHIGIAVGDLNLMPLRAFSSTHHGFIGDSLNMTARLMSSAGPSEIYVSNGLLNALPARERQGFVESPPVDGKNVGLIRCFRLGANAG